MPRNRSHEDDVAAQEIGERLRRIKDFPRTNHWLIGDDISKISKSGVDGIYPELICTTNGLLKQILEAHLQDWLSCWPCCWSLQKIKRPMQARTTVNISTVNSYLTWLGRKSVNGMWHSWYRKRLKTAGWWTQQIPGRDWEWC